MSEIIRKSFKEACDAEPQQKLLPLPRPKKPGFIRLNNITNPIGPAAKLAEKIIEKELKDA